MPFSTVGMIVLDMLRPQDFSIVHDFLLLGMFIKFVIIFPKILVARRWFDDKIEIQNTNIELNEKSLNEIFIEENFKLFFNNIHWQNTKKYILPNIFNFDERNEVKTFFCFSWM